MQAAKIVVIAQVWSCGVSSRRAHGAFDRWHYSWRQTKKDPVSSDRILWHKYLLYRTQPGSGRAGEHTELNLLDGAGRWTLGALLNGELNLVAFG